MSGLLYATTANLGLKKVKDGERYWGSAERENLDKIDLVAGLVMASGKIKIGLTPQSASLSGRTSEPQITIVEGTNNNWFELRFPYDTETAAKWMISGAETSDFVAGDKIQIIIRYKSTPITGSVKWAATLMTIPPGTSLDAVPPAARLFPTDQAAVMSEGVNEVVLEFSPTNAELLPGYPCIITISRKTADAGDNMADFAKFLEASIELDLPKRTPTFTNYYNNLTMVGGVPDPSDLQLYYDPLGRIIESIEHIAGMVRHMYFTYDAAHNLKTVVTEWDGVRRTETYVFDEYYNVLSMTANEVVI